MLVLHMTHTALLGSSSPGNKPSYQLAAIQLGNELVERNIDLVYGGGSVGLMGLISQAVYDGGHHVLGVIPKTLMPREGTIEINGKSALETKMERLDYKSTKLRFLM